MSRYLINPTAEQEEIIHCFLEEQHIDYVKEDREILPDFVLEGIKRGQEDIKAGRFITHEEFKKRHISFK